VALAVRVDHPLAALTTLGLGGPAAHFVEATRREDLYEALAWARTRELPVGILGGGSNLVVGDAGFAGMVVRIATSGVELTRGDGHATLTAQAGESWDDLVSLAIQEDLVGIECLSGIPGSVGATPIQNVGAYGQEVSDVVQAVEVFDRELGSSSWLLANECEFGYRDSRFKRDPGRFVVLSVRFKLQQGQPQVPRYSELARTLAVRSHAPTLRDIQQAVRSLRANKGMLIEPGWQRSAGSFFTNPVVSVSEADRVEREARARDLLQDGEAMPRFAAPNDRVKLAAAWLIERSGIKKGLQRGPVGVSTQHALALVHYGGGSTRDLMALATEIQQHVVATFAVALNIEPVRWDREK
jgi:UDP-N-acetylmuramate dehydrogenase